MKKMAIAKFDKGMRSVRDTIGATINELCETLQQTLVQPRVRIQALQQPRCEPFKHLLTFLARPRFLEQHPRDRSE